MKTEITIAKKYKEALMYLEMGYGERFLDDLHYQELRSEIIAFESAEIDNLLPIAEGKQEKGKEYVNEFEFLNHFLSFVSDKTIATLSKREIINNYLSSSYKLNLESIRDILIDFASRNDKHNLGKCRNTEIPALLEVYKKGHERSVDEYLKPSK